MAFNELDLAREISRLEIPRSGSSRRQIAVRIYARFGKRLLDIVLSLALLPSLLLLMGAIWLLVRRDGGPALFVQPRIGRGGRVFACYKFRTMIPEAELALERMIAADPAVAEEWRVHQKLRNDPRITAIGRLLRKTSLDELPQILNVLKGEMSLVGPRPFLPAQRAIYDAAGGRAYYRLRPGVTGLWQVMSRNDTTFATRVRFDEAYGANLRAAGDLALILRTARVVLLHTGA